MKVSVEKPFREILMITQESAANENLGTAETVENIITDLRFAGYAIKRAFEPVDYRSKIAVLHQSNDSRCPQSGCFVAQAQTEAEAVSDLAGGSGWLVTWVQNGLVRSAWFDGEGVSRLLSDYRVVNPKTPCAGAVAENGTNRKAA